MFAVQGWNVPTTKLVQEHAQRTATASAGNREPSNPSKKRKRPDRDVEKSRKIHASELEMLWDQRFGKEYATAAKHKPGKDVAAAKLPEPRKDGSRTAQSSHYLEKTLLANDQPNNSDVTRQKNKSDRKSEKQGREKSHNTAGVGKPEKRSKQSHSHDQTQGTTDDAQARSITTHLPPPPPPATNLTPLQTKMRSKLTSARFRHLNETLYTTSSSTALSLFTTSPDLFAEYHAGFSQQVSSSWPRNPVEDFISAIKTRGPLNLPPSSNITPLPRRKTQSCTVADLGCGDAPLARALIPGFTKKLHLTIHSYDLHAPNTHVTVADIANLPLRDGEADIAIFCLSLMGTNWVDFVEEAWRVLRGDGKGEIWVAEVKSRFGRPRSSGSGLSHRAGEAVAHSVGKRQKPAVLQQKGRGDGKKNKKTNNKGEGEDLDDDTELPPDLFTSNDDAAAKQNGATDEETPDLRPFIDVFARRGFQLKPNSVDAKNKMFVSMTFFKSGIPTVGKHKGMKWTGKQYERMGKGRDSDDEAERNEEGKVLKPCVYKTR